TRALLWAARSSWPGRAGAEEGAGAEKILDGRDELEGVQRLLQEPISPGLQRLVAGLQGRDGQHRSPAALLELPAQLQAAAGGDEQVDHGHAGGQLVELAGRLGGVTRRRDLAPLGA